MIEAILWDNDGVLVDTEKLYYRANRDILAKLGVRLTPEQFTEVSLHRGESVLEAAREHGVDPDTLRPRRNAHYREILLAEAETAEHARETLEALSGRVRMGIVTSALPEQFHTINDRLGLLTYMEFVVTRDDYTHGKPAPDPYLTGLARGGFDPSRTIAVEDSLRGLGSANAAGLRCIVVRTPFTEGMDFPGAWHVAADLREVKHVLLDTLGK